MKVSKILFYISVLSSIYFLLLVLNRYVFKCEFVLIGVVQELITIPIMFAQFIICIASLIYWVKDGFRINEYSLWAFVISICNSLIIIGTFLQH